ncbi:MAG TPA: ribbon-helix-helix protein, CopG family [Spirochaetia bacterium]|nr:ribbon-helix-helix protein, CopG family [Spirochaetia bacterium]
MKTITVHVSEETYRAFQDFAAKSKQSAAELIRVAMDEYHENHLVRRGSIFDDPGVDAGRVISPLISEDDLLDEMLT